MSPIDEDEKGAPPAVADVETGLTGGEDVPPPGDDDVPPLRDDAPPPRPRPAVTPGNSLRNVFSRPLPNRRVSIHDTSVFDSLKRSVHSDSVGALTNVSFRSSVRSIRSAGGKSDDDDDVHSRMLALAIENACHSAYGIIGVDVWIYDEDDGSFHHAPGGYHRHYLYKPENFKQQMALKRVEDETLVNYVPPTRQVPGAGLAGYFW